MESRHIDTIDFTDSASGDDAIAIVRQIGNEVALCLSLLQDGDIEVFMNRQTAIRLHTAIGEAITAGWGFSN